MVDAPKRASARRGDKRERKKKGKGGIILFLLVSALPVAAITWYVLQPQAKQDEIAAIFGDGAGGRAAKAGICLAILFALAKVALPAFHATSGLLRGWMQRIREKKGAARILLWPVEFVIWLVWFASQLLFALDAILILATGALFLILAVRIVDSSVLQDTLPKILQ